MKTTKNESKYKINSFYCFCRIEIIKSDMFSNVNINMNDQ